MVELRFAGWQLVKRIPNVELLWVHLSALPLLLVFGSSDPITLTLSRQALSGLLFAANNLR